MKDWGATGNGITDDTAAINAAIAQLNTANYQTLYFPAGQYVISGSLTGITGVASVTIRGDGNSSRIFSNVAGAAGNTFYVSTTCTYVAFMDLAIWGSANLRGSGIHIRLYASYSKVVRCYIAGCSDFGIHLHNDSGGAYNDGSSVENCEIVATLGDGIHVGACTNFKVANNIILSTGDDAIGVGADIVAYPPMNGEVSDNVINNAGILGTSGCGIRLFDAVTDISVKDNHIKWTRENAIKVCRANNPTSGYSARVHISGNEIYQSTYVLGPLGAIWVSFLNESSVCDNEIYDTQNGSDICFLDFNQLTIKGNLCTNAPSRSIASDDGTTTNVAANWYNLVIQDNIIQSVQANEAIYVVPAVGILITYIIIQGNSGNILPAGDWIFCARVATGKITNNTSTAGRSVTTGGLTAVNNN